MLQLHIPLQFAYFNKSIYQMANFWQSLDITTQTPSKMKAVTQIQNMEKQFLQVYVSWKSICFS